MAAPLRNRTLTLVCMLLCALGAACGSPSTAEGSVEGRSFALDNAHAEVRQHGDRSSSIVIAEAVQPSTQNAAEQLWLVILHLPAGTEITTRESLKLGPRGSGLASLQVSVGELETLDEHGKVVNAKEPIFVDALSGTVTLWQTEGMLAGEFDALLEKGGYVQGAFEIRLD